MSSMNESRKGTAVSDTTTQGGNPVKMFRWEINRSDFQQTAPISREFTFDAFSQDNKDEIEWWASTRFGRPEFPQTSNPGKTCFAVPVTTATIDLSDCKKGEDSDANLIWAACCNLQSDHLASEAGKAGLTVGRRSLMEIEDKYRYEERDRDEKV
jgi:hypothetical protein